RAGTRGSQLPDERCEVREPAELAVHPRRSIEIQIGECVRVPRAGTNPEIAQQCLADEVRWPAGCAGDAKVHRWFAVVNRIELRVAVGVVQEAYVSER